MMLDLYNCPLQSGMCLKMLSRNPEFDPSNSGGENSRLIGRNHKQDQSLGKPIKTYSDIKMTCYEREEKSINIPSFSDLCLFFICWLTLKMLNSSHELHLVVVTQTLAVLFTYVPWFPAWAAPLWTFAPAASTEELKDRKHRKRNKSIIAGTHTAPSNGCYKPVQL